MIVTDSLLSSWLKHNQHHMTRSLPIALLLLCSVCVFAQPTITADWAGSPGESIAQSESSVIPDVSAKGADAIWDFSGIVEVDSTRLPLLFVQADTTPFADEFPGANQCLYATESDPDVGMITAYQYSAANDTEWNILGSQASSSFGSISRKYSDPERVLKFPLTYEDSYSDLYAGETDLQVAKTQFGGLSIYEADAFGTVILPNGEFENCLRVVRSNAQLDTTDLGLGIIEIVVSGSTTYTWYNPAYPGPLAIYEEFEFYTVAILDPLPPDTSSTVFDTTFIFDPTAVISQVEELDLEAFDMTSAPNPFTDEFVLTYDLENPEQVRIELYDMQGQQQYSQSVDAFQGKNTHSIDASGFPPGNYSLIVRGSDKFAVDQVVKVD